MVWKVSFLNAIFAMLSQGYVPVGVWSAVSGFLQQQLRCVCVCVFTDSDQMFALRAR